MDVMRIVDDRSGLIADKKISARIFPLAPTPPLPAVQDEEVQDEEPQAKVMRPQRRKTPRGSAGAEFK